MVHIKWIDGRGIKGGSSMNAILAVQLIEKRLSHNLKFEEIRIDDKVLDVMAIIKAIRAD